MPGRCNHIPTGAEARRREAEGTAHALGFMKTARARGSQPHAFAGNGSGGITVPPRQFIANGAG